MTTTPPFSVPPAGDLRRSITQAAASLAKIWDDPIPELDDKARKTADQAADGVINFWFNGLTPVRVGRKNIDWTGKHIAHQEWRAQLNRFFCFPALASALRATGDSRYAQAARDYLEEWINFHPAGPTGFALSPHDNILNLGIRLGDSNFPGWLGTLTSFATADAFDDAFLAKVVKSAADQLDLMARKPAPAINWRIANADCLIASSLRIPHHPYAARWREIGLRILNDSFHRQVLADGAHSERNPGYHHWMLSVFHRYLRLGEAKPELRIAVTKDAVARMYDYGVATLRPNNTLCAIHDCQGSRITPAPEDAKYYNIRKGFSDLASDRADFRRHAGLSDTPAPLSAFFPQAGQHFSRTSWSEDATYFTFDATLWGGAHCHLSRNAIQLHAHGKTLLCDLGWLTYESSDPAAAHGRSTRAHNTLNLNGWNQCPTDPSRTIVHASKPGEPGYDLVRSDYEGGYWEGKLNWSFDRLANGVWASHCRVALFVHDLGVLVIDSMYREPASEKDDAPPSMEANWQLCEGSAAVDPANARAFTTHDRDNLMLLFPVMPPGSTLSLHSGERDPLRGWLPVGAGLTPAPQICVNQPRMSGRYSDVVTFLMPFKEASPPSVVVVGKPPTNDAPTGLVRLHKPDGASDVFLWRYRLDSMLGRMTVPGTSLEIETDASLVHLRFAADGKTVLRAAALGGTYFAPWRKEALRSPEAIVVVPA